MLLCFLLFKECTFWFSYKIRNNKDNLAHIKFNITDFSSRRKIAPFSDLKLNNGKNIVGEYGNKGESGGQRSTVEHEEQFPLIGH